MKIFTVSHGDYEVYSPYHVIAPEGVTEEQFEQLCNDLIGEAVDELIRRKGHAIYPPDEEMGDQTPTWIGWSEIVETIARRLLPARGYQYVRFFEVQMIGGGIIGGTFHPVPYEESEECGNPEHTSAKQRMPKEIYEKVQNYNLAVRESLDKSWKDAEAAESGGIIENENPGESTGE